MTACFRMAGVALLLLACTNKEPENQTQQTTRSTADHSAFQTYSVTRRPGFGFCFNAGDIYDATLTRTGAQVSISFRVGAGGRSCDGGDPNREECLGLTSGTKMLSTAQADEFTTLSRAVQLVTGDNAMCESDCARTMATWDAQTYSGGGCNGTRMDDAYIQTMMEALNRFAATP